MAFVLTALVCGIAVAAGALGPWLDARAAVRVLVVGAPSLALGAVLAVSWSTDWGLESGWFNDHHGEPVFPTKAAELLALTGLAVFATALGLAVGAVARGLHLAGRRRSPG